MSDVFTKRKRSEVMSRIRGRGNKETELAFASLLRRLGITGWRRHQPLLGKPDFTFRRRRIVVFVDGCFWHGCPKHSSMPVNNRKFWKEKLAANKRRDQRVTRTLRKQGWLVLRLWEHDLAARRRSASKVERVVEILKTHDQAVSEFRNADGCPATSAKIAKLINPMPLRKIRKSSGKQPTAP